MIFVVHFVCCSAFRKAKGIDPNITAFQGLTCAYLACGKHKEALVVAREAVRLMPSSSQAIVLLGDVYARQADSRDRAMKMFEGVLQNDPNCNEAISSIIDVHIANRNLVAAEHVLSRHLESNVNDELHTRLAGILTESQDYSRAMEHYHIALSLNEKNEEAHAGIERLEKLMKGIDPDMVSDDEAVEAAEEESDFI